MVLEKYICDPLFFFLDSPQLMFDFVSLFFSSNEKHMK